MKAKMSEGRMGGQNCISGKETCDYVKVLQQNRWPSFGPLARSSCLNNHKIQAASTDYFVYNSPCVPLLDIIEGINTNVKLSHQAEGPQPRTENGLWRTHWLHYGPPNTRAITGTPQQWLARRQQAYSVHPQCMWSFVWEDLQLQWRRAYLSNDRYFSQPFPSSLERWEYNSLWWIGGST